ncbi:hypothetical protein [uncultured Anaerococcus sp.]|uniref:hypothetical protein n=1 Tax=uncultured Anaerococcus sp. TaxID=293428 RepID=UPI0026119734|nr:hypothetical protein [uncultured Anaerococcus sp.]
MKKYYNLKAFLLSTLVSIIIILALGAIQTLALGYDPNAAIDSKVFKLYLTLCIFVVYTLIARIQYRRDL